MKKETSHSNKKSSPVAKSGSLYKTAKDLLSFGRLIDPGDKFIANLAEWMLEWSQKETSEDMYAAFHEFGIPSRSYYNFLEKYPLLAQAHSVVKERLGVRLQKMARHKEYNCDPKTITTTLRVYHPEWQQIYEDEKEFRLQLAEKGKENQGNATFVIHTNQLPEGESYAAERIMEEPAGGSTPEL